MKPSKVGQDFNHTGIKYPMAIDTQPYTRCMAWVFWGGVATVFAVAIFGFINF